MGSKARTFGGAVALAGGLTVGVRAAHASERSPLRPPEVALVVAWSSAEGRASSAATGVDAERGGGLVVGLVATWRPPARGPRAWADDDPLADPLADSFADPRVSARWPGEGLVGGAERAAQLAALRAERAALDSGLRPTDPRGAVELALRRAELDAWIAVIDPRPWQALAGSGEGP